MNFIVFVGFVFFFIFCAIVIRTENFKAAKLKDKMRYKRYKTTKPEIKDKHEHNFNTTESKTRKFVETVLTDWKKGRNLHFDKSGLALFSIKSWEITDIDVDATSNTDFVIVIIDSSTKDGFPVRKTWKFTIYQESESGDYIIQDINAVDI